jgi:hypothetical protein
VSAERRGREGGGVGGPFGLVEELEDVEDHLEHVEGSLQHLSHKESELRHLPRRGEERRGEGFRGERKSVIHIFLVGVLEGGGISSSGSRSDIWIVSFWIFSEEFQAIDRSFELL